MTCDCITCIGVTRGTTPTLELHADVDLTKFDEARLAFRSGWDTVVKTLGDMEIEPAEEGCDIKVALTQADTLAFKPGRAVEVQLRFRKGDAADATDIALLKVGDIIEEGEI